MCIAEDDPACKLAKSFLILWLEILGITAAILLLIAVAIIGVICYVRRVRRKDNERLVNESKLKYA